MNLFSQLRNKIDGIAGWAAIKAMNRYTDCTWKYESEAGDIYCKHLAASLADCAKGKVWMVQRHSYAKTVWEIENDGGIDGEAQV